MHDKNPGVKCTVSSCKFNNNQKHFCQLNKSQWEHMKKTQSNVNVLTVSHLN